MFVVGIDPGLTRCGYCVVEAREGASPRAVALGVMRTSPEDEVHHRLAELQSELRALLAEFPVTAMAVERVLFQVNVRTAMSVGQASGIAMVEAVNAGCEVVQYSPNEVKSAVAFDAADAAALALCHIAMAPMRAAANRAVAKAGA